MFIGKPRKWIRAIVVAVLVDIVATEAGISVADAQMFIALWSNSHA